MIKVSKKLYLHQGLILQTHTHTHTLSGHRWIEADAVRIIDQKQDMDAALWTWEKK